MARELRCTLAVVAPVNVDDRQAGEFFFSDAAEAAQVNAEHLADGRLGPHAERAHTAVPAEIVLVLPWC